MAVLLRVDGNHRRKGLSLSSGCPFIHRQIEVCQPQLRQAAFLFWLSESKTSNILHKNEALSSWKVKKKVLSKILYW